MQTCERWVRSASEYGYPVEGGAFHDLACRVLYGQAREEPQLLRAMAEELGELADELLERRELRRRHGGSSAPLEPPEREFLRACCELPAALEACIGLHAARVVCSAPARAPGLYAWSLTGTLLRRFESRDGDVFFRHLAESTAAHAPVAWRSLTQTVAEVRQRMDASLGWPTAEDAHRLACLFGAIEPTWSRYAAALRRGDSPRATSSDQRRLARKAAGACRMARHTFVRLSSPSGWLRLHVEYLLELLEGISRLCREGRPPEEFADVAIHELGFVLSSTVGGPAPANEVAPHPYADNHSGGVAERKRIERGRTRCLARWVVVEPDPFWDEYDVWGALEDIAHSPALSEAPPDE
ncbi:MAG: hypothetical protein H6744_02960 [Deltaproteobacteria bacterium]|nr:hypothetical protein [Deltaproteobacteria bacterium]MCB9785634.1 hypothetical protein [Deltaproteobacteria bacterium]